MGDAAWPSGKVALMCPSHGYLLYLEAKNIYTHHSSDSDKGEIIKDCISPDFFHCKGRNPIPKCLKHITDKSGVSQGQQDPGSQAKALKLRLCLSPLSLFSLCVSVIPPWARQPIHLVTRGLPATLSLHSSRQKSPRKAFLRIFFGRSPEPSLRLSLSCSPIPEAIMAAQQVIYSG